MWNVRCVYSSLELKFKPQLFREDSEIKLKQITGHARVEQQQRTARQHMGSLFPHRRHHAYHSWITRLGPGSLLCVRERDLVLWNCWGLQDQRVFGILSWFVGLLRPALNVAQAWADLTLFSITSQGWEGRCQRESVLKERVLGFQSILQLPGNDCVPSHYLYFPNCAWPPLTKLNKQSNRVLGSQGWQNKTQKQEG